MPESGIDHREKLKILASILALDPKIYYERNHPNLCIESDILAKDPLYEPTDFAGHLVPGIWKYMLPKDLLSMRTPDERRATCMNCPKIVSEGFRPDYRCCTYHPSVPNYALGLALKTKLGKKPVRALIKNGHVLPEGSVHTPEEWIDYLADNAEDKFGRSKRVLCHLLDKKTGYCTIYAFRNSVCSTFFCMNDHGDAGQSYWDAVQELVCQVESVLSQWSLNEVGFDVARSVAAHEDLSAEIKEVSAKKGGWRKRARKALFGNWYGKEEELFVACGEVISQNRESLWDIANEFEMIDASAFHKAQVEMVPKKFRHEIDPEDFEDGDMVAPQDLWKELRRKYRGLWKVPHKRLVLNARAHIVENDLDGKEEEHFSDRSHVLEFLTKKNSDTYEWRNFLSKDEYVTLARFQKPQTLGASLWKRLPKNAEGLVAEWYKKKVLVKAVE